MGSETYRSWKSSKSIQLQSWMFILEQGERMPKNMNEYVGDRKIEMRKVILEKDKSTDI